MKKILVILAFILCFLGCQNGNEKVLKMATNANFPPYEFVGDNGQFAGIDIEIAQSIAKKLKYKLEIQNMEFGSIIPAVTSKKVDIGLSGFTITEERKQSVNFSSSYASSKQVIIVQENSAIKSVDDLYKANNVKIGTQLSTTGAIYVGDDISAGKIKGAMEEFANGVDAVNALSTGKLDCVIIDEHPAQNFIAGYKNLKILNSEFIQEDYAIVLNKDDTELLAKINKALDELKTEGVLEKIVEKYINAKHKKVDGESQKDKISGWFEGFKSAFVLNFIEGDRYLFLLQGLKVTLIITFFASIIGIILGFIVAFVRSTYDKHAKEITGAKKKILCFFNAVFGFYLTVIRGTPVVVQLMIMYYIIFASSTNSVLIAILAFGINSGAYVAEIFRSGIMSVDKGQFEAGRSLGFNYFQTMRYIVFPQAFKNVLPALANEFIVLLKETSVAGYVAITDLTRAGDIIRGRTFSAFMPLIAVALIYLVIVMILSWFVSKLERKLRASEH